jgi:hypothetical protein
MNHCDIVLSNSDIPPEFQFVFNREECLFLAKDALSKQHDIPVELIPNNLELIVSKDFRQRLIKRQQCISFLRKRGVVLEPSTPASEVARMTVREKIRETGRTVPDDIPMVDLRPMFASMHN